jgi:MoaA/NifB/PqqE/SkfB family radical SAM enzyme
VFDALKVEEEPETSTGSGSSGKEVDVNVDNARITPGESLKDNELVGSKDLTDPENLQLKTVSLSLTHRTQFQQILTSPIQKKCPEDKELGTYQWKKIIDQLSEEGVENVVLTGGEPTIRPDFHTILQYCINNFENVTVQTNGTTNRNLSDYDCVVSLPIDYWNPIDNNEIRRLTDPEMYLYHRNKGKLIPKEKTKCSFCGEDKFQKEHAAKSHIAMSHKVEAVEEANEMVQADIEGTDDIREHPTIGWDDFLVGEEVKITEKEVARTLAQQKIEGVENDVVIRTTIMNNNDLDKIIAYAQIQGVDVAFKPLYPNGHRKLEEQIPSPKRILSVMEKVWQLNGEIKENLSVKSPLYKAWSFQTDLSQGIEPEIDQEKYLEWLKRGRVSEVGVSKVHIRPDGVALPSKYLREYELGSVADKGIGFIYNELSNFNKEIIDPELDYREAFSYESGEVKDFPDLHRRNIAGDPNIYLNKSYNNTMDENLEQDSGGDK